MERAVQITRRNNYTFSQPKYLELLVEVNITSRPKHGWSVLQSAFTVPKFRTTVGDALTPLLKTPTMDELNLFGLTKPDQFTSRKRLFGE
jgi:hypothetical protein